MKQKIFEVNDVNELVECSNVSTLSSDVRAIEKDNGIVHEKNLTTIMCPKSNDSDLTLANAAKASADFKNSSCKQNINGNSISFDQDGCSSKLIQHTQTVESKRMDSSKNPETLSFADKLKSISEDIQRNIAYETSPDLFDCDEDNKDAAISKDLLYYDELCGTITETPQSESEVYRRERMIFDRMKISLSGVPPPPSMTILQFDIFESVLSKKGKIFEFFEDLKTTVIPCKQDVHRHRSIFSTMTNIGEVQKIGKNFKEILNANSYGVCYNTSSISEKIELLSLSVTDRYIGSETASSYCNQASVSSAKKRNIRSKMLRQSPGNRLSHLAKRRAIFSSATLQTSNLGCNSSSLLGGRQILLDQKKSTNRRKMKIITPKRISPSRRKFNDHSMKTGPSRENSKRALFQSPAKQNCIPKIIAIKPEVASRVEKSKRALFSPCRNENSNNSEENQTFTCGPIDGSLISGVNSMKRKFSEINNPESSCKLFRRDSSSTKLKDLTPRSLKFKSQSFCIGASEESSDLITGKTFFRASSDTTFCNNQLSDSHKKKLLWAVSQALQTKQINGRDPRFKQYASVLARVVKRIYLEFSEKIGSTSDNLLKLSKKYVFWVTQGKSADEIYLHEKMNIRRTKAVNSSKINGYIAPDEYEKLSNLKKASSCFFSDNSFDSFNMDAADLSQSTDCLSVMSKESHTLMECSNNISSIRTVKLPILPNKSLQSSSSKNNLPGMALRENFDCEQRKSGQKNFTGKDQKNISPYQNKSCELKKQISFLHGSASSLRARRQISFDS